MAILQTFRKRADVCEKRRDRRAAPPWKDRLRSFARTEKNSRFICFWNIQNTMCTQSTEVRAPFFFQLKLNPPPPPLIIDALYTCQFREQSREEDDDDDQRTYWPVNIIYIYILLYCTGPLIIIIKKTFELEYPSSWNGFGFILGHNNETFSFGITRRKTYIDFCGS